MMRRRSLGKDFNWQNVDKDQYQQALERSPINDIEHHLLAGEEKQLLQHDRFVTDIAGGDGMSLLNDI